MQVADRCGGYVSPVPCTCHTCGRYKCFWPLFCRSTWEWGILILPTSFLYSHYHHPPDPARYLQPQVRGRWGTVIWASYQWQRLRLVCRCRLAGNVEALLWPTWAATTRPGRHTRQYSSLVGLGRYGQPRGPEDCLWSFPEASLALRPWFTRLFCVFTFLGPSRVVGYKWCLKQDKNLVLETSRLWSPYKGALKGQKFCQLVRELKPFWSENIDDLYWI